MSRAMLIGANPVISTYGPGRQFTSVAVWEALTGLNLVAEGRSEHLACYAGAYDELFTIAGATTDSSYFRSIGPVPGHEHRGIPGSGVHFSHTGTSLNIATIQEANFSIFDVEFTLTSTLAAGIPAALFFSTGSSGQAFRVISTCLNPSGATTRAIAVTSAAGPVFAVNCLVRNSFRGFQCSASTLYTYNNTASGNTNAFVSSSGTFVCRNNIASGIGASSNFAGVFDASSSHNASHNTTIAGTSGRINQVFSFVNEAGGDFHLLEADLGAKGFGVDLSGDALWPFSDDIDGGTRAPPWDIGFDQFGSVLAAAAEVDNLLLLGVT